jgi:hypothetical protein
MSKTINQKLKMTPEEYEDLIFGAYARWCESVTINTHEFQKVLANSSINKWFMMEYSKCEKEFKQLTARYEENDTIIAEDFKRCYSECTYRMFNIRPMALLQEINKKKSVDSIKFHGVKIETLNFNLN